MVDFDDAKFIFSEDSECDDTKRFVNLLFPPPPGFCCCKLLPFVHFHTFSFSLFILHTSSSYIILFNLFHLK